MSEVNETAVKPQMVHEAEAMKLRAEARLADAKAVAEDRESRANESRLLAERLRLEAETQQINAEHQKVNMENTIAAINMRTKIREEREEHSANKFRNIYYFDSEVDSGSVKACIKQIDIWKYASGEDAKNVPINIVFTSPGGSIIDGFVLFDYIQKLRRDGHVVTTGTYGMAASMAGILLQAGSARWMSKESWVLIHEAAFGAHGKFGAVEDTVLLIKRIQSRILDIFAERAHASLDKNNPARRINVVAHRKEDQEYTVELPNVPAIKAYLAKRWDRKDWWLSSDECYELGLVDEVR